MTVNEYIFRVIAYSKPLVPSILGVLIVTILILPFLLKLSKNLWVNHNSYKWLGIFYSLTNYQCMVLACCWIKFIMLIVYVVQFQKLQAIHYVAFLIPGLIYALNYKRISKIPARLVWVALQSIGLVAINLICGYMIDVKVSFIYLSLYICLGLFLIMFAVYSFITELNEISLERKCNFEK